MSVASLDLTRRVVCQGLSIRLIGVLVMHKEAGCLPSLNRAVHALASGRMHAAVSNRLSDLGAQRRSREFTPARRLIVVKILFSLVRVSASRQIVVHARILPESLIGASNIFR